MIDPNNLQELPKGWVWTILRDLVANPNSEIVDGPFGSDLKASEYVGKGIPIVRLQNIERNKFINKNIRFITPWKAKELERHNYSKNDILITKLGSPLGKACLVPVDAEDGIVVADVVRVRLNHQNILKLYLVNAINSDQISKQLEDLTKGTTRPRVNLKHIRELYVPLAPLPEQHRIVNKIEELFTKLDAGVEALKKIQLQLKRYRQSVLKAAFEGQLTAEWREAHKSELEPASVLLDRIKAERKKKLGSKYKELPSVDTSELPELPDGWEWMSVEQITDVGTGATPLKSKKEYYDQGNISWITSGALNEEFVRKADEFITDLALKETNAKVFPVHTLLVAMYGEGKTRGKVSELMIEAATNQACAALIFDGYASNLRPFIKSFFEKNYQDIRRLSSGGVQPNLNLGIIKATNVPIPPLSEQKQINEEIDRHFSITEDIEKSVEDSLKQSERMRQSILTQAFKGKLVPQDPKDEPAERLIQHIQQDRKREPSYLGHRKSMQEIGS